MPTWPDIPGQELIELAGERPPRLVIEPAAPIEPLAGPAAARWSELCRANPRLHDGNMLSCVRIETGTEPGNGPGAARVIRARRERFARLAVQGAVEASGASIEFGVRMLGVKGLIIGRDRAGEEHVLIARRGRETRVYGDMWEIAPAGGIGVPRQSGGGEGEAGVTELASGALTETLVEEAQEELGIDVRECCGTPRAVAIVRDELARSVEVIVRAEWARPIDPRRAVCASGSGGCGAGASAWEYSDSAWLARREAREFDRRSAEAIVGPMRAVLRWMGWC